MANTASWRPMREENGKPLIRELVKLIHLIFRTDVSGCGFAGMVGPALSSVQLKAAESNWDAVSMSSCLPSAIAVLCPYSRLCAVAYLFVPQCFS